MITRIAKSGTSALNPASTVNALIAQHPSVLPVLNGYGIDTCCGGAESLEDAARTAGIPVDVLMAGVSAAVEPAVSLPSHDARLSPAAGADR